MQFTVLATLIAGVAAFTVPVVERTNCPSCPSCPSSSYNPCPGALYAAPVCGALDLLGVACLDVAPRTLFSFLPALLHLLTCLFSSFRDSPRCSRLQGPVRQEGPACSLRHPAHPRPGPPLQGCRRHRLNSCTIVSLLLHSERHYIGSAELNAASRYIKEFYYFQRPHLHVHVNLNPMLRQTQIANVERGFSL